MTTTTPATTTACRVLARLEHAWNTADGEGYGRQYTDDATFVNVHGDLATGPEAIAAGHDEIFSTIYAGSTNRMHLVEAVRVADGVIAAVSRNTLAVPAGPLAGIREALVTSVLVGGADGWRVSASQTTRVGAR